MSVSSSVQWFARPDLALHSRPEALEVRVEVSGTQVQGGSGPRALFSEQTVTTLVFEDGAVVRLCAAVAVGQLVFVKQLESQKEIVARVLKQRSFGEGNAYVELEFTDAAPGFWGADFPPATNEAPVTAASVDTTDDMYVLLANLAETKEAEQPRPELGGIASQMSALLGDTAHAHPIDGQRVDAVVAPAAAALTVADLAPVRVGEAPREKRAAEDSRHLRDSDGISALQSPPASARAHEASTEEEFSEGDNEQAQDKAEQSNEAATEESLEEAAPATNSRMRVLVMAAVLALTLAGGIAWQRDALAGWLGNGKSAVDTSAGSVARTAAARPHGAPVIGNISAPVAGGPKQLGANAARGDAATTVAENEAADAQSDSHTASAARSGDEAASGGDDAATEGSSTSATSSGTENAEDGYEPPKLLKAVNAVPPPEAVQNFVTGDVKFDALVDTKGKVSSANVISGPAALHAAALDALRRYEYKPAVKNGQAVPGHVTVSVKFWYEP